jgi:endogenous inhibitor of DNA gyrase (YacG/DUF329 family)
VEIITVKCDNCGKDVQLQKAGQYYAYKRGKRDFHCDYSCASANPKRWEKQLAQIRRLLCVA